MRILVAPWGWPKNYGKSKYRIGEKLIPSKTSTGALKKYFKPDHTFVIVQDSLAVYYPETFEAENYLKLSQSLRNFLINDYFSNEEFLPDFSPKVDKILIAPNVGSFTNRDKNKPAKLTIKGKMSDYYYWALYNLSRLIIDKSIQTDELTLILDTTHGQNFMLYLTFSALYNIAAILSLKFTNKIKLEIYNADPYLEEATYLEINLVRELYPKFQMTLKFSPHGFLPLKVNKSTVSQEELKKLSKEIQSSFRTNEKLYKETFLPFLGAFTQGIVHGVMHFFPPDTDDLEDTICEFYNKKIQLIPQGENHSMVVSRRLYFTEFFEALIYVRNLRTVMESIGIRKKEEVSLAEIRQWAEELYEEFPVVHARTLYELDDLKRKIIPQKVISEFNEWKSYGKCVAGINIHKRNFFAHAGFSENSIEVKKLDNDFQIRFCKHAMSIILNYLKETVSKS